MSEKAKRIVIKIVRRPGWIGGSGSDCAWVAEETETKRRSSSLIGPMGAVRGCALNYFFGGQTKAFVRGRGERVKVKKRGARFVAIYSDSSTVRREPRRNARGPRALPHGVLQP